MVKINDIRLLAKREMPYLVAMAPMATDRFCRIIRGPVRFRCKNQCSWIERDVHQKSTHWNFEEWIVTVILWKKNFLSNMVVFDIYETSHFDIWVLASIPSSRKPTLSHFGPMFHLCLSYLRGICEKVSLQRQDLSNSWLYRYLWLGKPSFTQNP